MSFDPNLPTDKDKVRLEVGDTDEDHEFLGDSIYEYLTETYTNLKLAASHAARMIAAKLARSTDYSFSTLGQSESQAYEHYTQLAKELEQQASMSMSAGPVHVHSGDEPADPIFDIGMHDYVDPEDDDDDD